MAKQSKSRIKPRCKTAIEVSRHVEILEPVRVYRNLHRKCMSVKQHGIVKCHADNIILQDVTFYVSAAGRERVRRERKKSVHAYAIGIISLEFPGTVRESDNAIELYYNPYDYDGFTNMSTGEVTESAQIVELDASHTGVFALA